MVIYGTALLPYIGYQKATDLMEKSMDNKKILKKLLEEETSMTKEEIERVFSIAHTSTYQI